MQSPTYQLPLPLLADADVAARGLHHGCIAPEHLLLAVAVRAGRGHEPAPYDGPDAR